MPDGLNCPVAFPLHITSNERKSITAHLWSTKNPLWATIASTLHLRTKRGSPAMAASRIQCWAILRSAYQYRAEFLPTGMHGNAGGPGPFIFEAQTFSIEAIGKSSFDY